MKEPSRNLLDPELVTRLRALELKAREVAEGALTGIHHSPHRGSSLEFAEHRPYSPGDEIKMIDWKLFAKSDRYFVKQFEDETNIRCVLMVDGSSSMAYPEKRGALKIKGEKERMSKLEYAQALAAAFAYLLLNQSDAAGLAVFGSGVLNYLPPRSQGSFLQPILQGLVEIAPQKGTDISGSVQNILERTHGRNLYIFFSDFFDEPGPMLNSLKLLKHRGHEVILFHILDRDEIEFPFPRLSVFEGMEEDARLLVDPRAIKEEYLRQINLFMEQIKSGCLGARMDYWLANTAVPLEECLSGFLALRAARKAVSRKRGA